MFEKRSLGIAFEVDGTVRAVELTSHLRTLTLTGAWTFQPGGVDKFDSWKQGMEKLRESGVSLDNFVIGVPDSIIYRKHLSFPFSSRKRIMQIINSELEGEIPLAIDDVVADFISGQAAGPGLQGTAMACDKGTLSRFLDLAGPGTRLRSVQTGAVGLATASLRSGIINGVSVHCGPGEGVLVEFRSSKVMAVKRLPLREDAESNAHFISREIRQHTLRGDDVYLECAGINDQVEAALEGEETLKIRSLSELDIAPGPAGAVGDTAPYIIATGLALAGQGIAEALPFDLRQGPFKQVTPLAGLKVPIFRSLALVVLLGVLGITSLVLNLNQARGEYQDLKGRLQSEFKELFPDSRPIDGQETAQIKGELDDLKKRMVDLSGLEGRGALSILAGLSAAIPDDVSLKLDELSYDAKKLRFEGSVSSFDAVDRIKAALDSDPSFADVQVQNARVGANINKVTFRLQMEVR